MSDMLVMLNEREGWENVWKLIGKYEGNKSFRKSTRSWQDDIEMDLKEKKGGLDWSFFLGYSSIANLYKSCTECFLVLSGGCSWTVLSFEMAATNPSAQPHVTETCIF